MFKTEHKQQNYVIVETNRSCSINLVVKPQLSVAKGFMVVGYKQTK